MKRTLFLVCTVLAAASCQRSSDRDSDSPPRSPSTSSPSTSPPSTSTPSTSTPSSAAAADRPGANPSTLNAPASAADERADNTGKNERDRSGATATPGDQGGSEADRQLTQEIRKAVVADSKLSMTAKNVKIITNDAVVTLRGPVKSSQEKSQIAALAQHVKGVKRVDNQLEIATK